MEDPRNEQEDDFVRVSLLEYLEYCLEWWKWVFRRWCWNRNWSKDCSKTNIKIIQLKRHIKIKRTKMHMLGDQKVQIEYKQPLVIELKLPNHRVISRESLQIEK